MDFFQHVFFYFISSIEIQLKICILYLISTTFQLILAYLIPHFMLQKLSWNELILLYFLDCKISFLQQIVSWLEIQPKISFFCYFPADFILSFSSFYPLEIKLKMSLFQHVFLIVISLFQLVFSATRNQADFILFSGLEIQLIFYSFLW